MQGNEQVLEFMEARAPTALIPKVRDMLGAFLFRGDDVYKPVSVLSGGEKSRLALLQLLLEPLNLLILDEPTNHLDLHSKDVLLDTLKKFPGTIILVSHDRSFMEALSTKTLELNADHTRAKLFYGNYAYYLERIASENSTEKDDGERTDDIIKPSGINTITVDNNVKPDGVNQRQINKQRQTDIRRLQKQEAEILNIIEGLEKEKVRLETDLSRPEVYSNGEKAKAVKQKLDEVDAAIAGKNAEWEAVAAKLE
jgi:ATP-binding cassette subfamily F protein 3